MSSASNIGMVFVFEGELLHQACLYDQADFLQQLLESDAFGTVESRNAQGQTPLHCACVHGSINCVRTLLQRGADPNAMSGLEDKCYTPLHHAAAYGHLDCVTAMLDYEANLDLLSTEGLTAIEVARQTGTPEASKCVQYMHKVLEQRLKDAENAKCEELYDVISNGNCERAKVLLKSILDPFAVINRYYRGPNTYLYRASIGGYADIVELLLPYNADGRPNADSGMTPLYAACYAGHLEVVKVLVEHFPKHLILPLQVDGTYPIHAACMRGHADVVRYLCSFRRQPGMAGEARPAHVPSTPPQAPALPPKTRKVSAMKEMPPARRNSVSSISELAEAEPETYYVDVNIPNKDGYTPLHCACLFGHLDVVQELLNCGTARTGVNATLGGVHLEALAARKSPLHYAVLLNNSEIARLLLENGADHSRLFDDNGQEVSPVFYAAETGKEAVLKVLLDSGAVDKGSKALLRAIEAGREHVLQVLLNNVVFTDAEGSTVLSASEIQMRLAPVIIGWNEKCLPRVMESWLLEASISRNLHAASHLRNAMDLTVKLITVINLSKNELESLPLLIFQLPSLKRLNVSYNRIANLPVSDRRQSSGGPSTENRGWHCPLLWELELQNNLLTSLPAEVFALPALANLNASCNRIAQLPFEMWTSPSLKVLILEGNEELTSLPFSRSGLADANRPPQVDQKFQSLPVARSEVEVVKPASLSQIFSKRPSWNGGNGESENDDEEEGESPATGKSSLNKLNLSKTGVQCIPTGLACLAPKLQKLYMSFTNLTQVPSISVLPENLLVLELSGNKLERFDLSAKFESGDFTCYGCRPPSFHSARKLRTRFCKHRKHTTLGHLTTLVLSKNLLTQFVLMHSSPHDKMLEKFYPLFPELKHLDLSNNGLLKTLSDDIGKFPELGLLDVSSTGIESLPSELSLCTKMFELKVDNLALRSPPRNIMDKRLPDGRRDLKSITGYLRSLHDKSVVYHNLKLMFVGVHCIGKTSLLELLRQNGTGSFQSPDHKGHFSERRGSERTKEKTTPAKGLTAPSTVGVNLSDWSYKKRQFRNAPGPCIKFSTWDFGGQTEYYATHQCFLTKRALYLLVWKLTDGIKGVKALETWLLNIQARARNANVIIVGTFFDELENRTRAQFVEDMRREIKSRYVSTARGGDVPILHERGLPNVIEIKEVSCKTGYNISELRDLIYEVALSMKSEDDQSVAHMLVPASYVEVERAVGIILGQMVDCMPVLGKDEFRARVVEIVQLRNGFDELDQAVQFLHDYGVLLHYDDPSLRDLYFLDPQWLCDMLAHVVTVGNVNPYIRNGVMKIVDLQYQIFKGEKRFPSNMVGKYVDLMGKFEVAIKISDKYLLIPSLLPDKQRECPVVAEQESPELRKAMNIYAYLHHRVYRRQYLMTYIPSGLWARLMTRLIADNRISRIVSACCQIQGVTNADLARLDAETLMQAAPPEWACWKTGIELSCFGTKLLRVCQLGQKRPFYGAAKPYKKIFVKSQARDTNQRLAIEILAPCVTLVVEKFTQPHPQVDGSSGEQVLIGFRVVGVSDASASAACQLLVLAVEHIDSLLGEWYMHTNLDSQTSIHGVKAVRRVGLCPECLMETIQSNLVDASQPNNMSSASLDDACGRSVYTDGNHDQEVFLPNQGAESQESDHIAASPPLLSVLPAGTSSNAEYENKNGPAVKKPVADECDHGPSFKDDSGSLKVADDHSSEGVGFDAQNMDSSCCDRGGVASSDTPAGYPHSDPPLHSSPMSMEPGVEVPCAAGVETAFGTGSRQVKDEEEELNEEYRMLAEGCIVAFEFDEGCKLLLLNKKLTCPFHGAIELQRVFPDICFQDLDSKYVIQKPSDIRREQFLASGAYGDVFRVSVRQPDDTWVLAAMKVPRNAEVAGLTDPVALANAEKNLRFFEAQPTIFSYESYKTVRQELGVLVPVKHANIVSLVGVQLNPFGMLLEFAPEGALDNHYANYRQNRQKLNPYVIQKALVQISSALKYLHRQHIIYRDLKCENILVWAFPGPNVAVPASRPVLVKMTDYGISRSVALSGAKGFQGTPGFMAPEILLYGGKESYTNKVDCFSFGSLMYELIALQPPFINECLNKASIANQYIKEGRRPELSVREKLFPVLMLSLLERCWAQLPDDRPSASEISRLSSLPEFSRLLDVLGVTEAFHPKCMTTTSASAPVAGTVVADSRNVVGSSVWLCGHENDMMKKKTPCFIRVFSYVDRKFKIVKDFQIHERDRIMHACTVGSTVWLGMASGIIVVFCALQQKPLALSRHLSRRVIFCMVHSPVCNTVLVSVSDGTILCYNDNVSGYAECLDHEPFFVDLPAGHRIRQFVPYQQFTCDVPVHCMAVVPSRAMRTYSDEALRYKDAVGSLAMSSRTLSEGIVYTGVDVNLARREKSTSFELWCGQVKGLITILELRSLRKMLTMPVREGDASNPVLKDLEVTFLETARSYGTMSQPDCSLSSYVWTAEYPGTQVCRWNVNSRLIEATFDARRYPPHNDLNSAKKRNYKLSASDCQITALLIVERDMYVGTPFGCVIVCDAIEFLPRMSVRCYEESVEFIVPLRMVSTRPRTDDRDTKLVLSCGRNCLDPWGQRVDKKRRLSKQESTMLTWFADPFY